LRRSPSGTKIKRGLNMTKLQNIISDAVEELKERYTPDEIYPEDICNEIADSAVPIYSHELAELASDSEVFFHENELGPAFGGEPTINNITATAVYELVSEAVFQALYELQDQTEVV